MAKLRADQLLVDRGLAESRAQAQALILAGLVFSGERKIDKAGQALAEDAPLEVRGKDHPWVSRGGIKLAHALDHFGWDVTGAVALDVGASTGGFTDVLLQRGAAKVFAVDVGTNQLAWKLRQDPRVVVHEKTNARYLTDARSSPSRSTSSSATRASSRSPRCSTPRSISPGPAGGWSRWSSRSSRRSATRSARAAWSAIPRSTRGSARRRRPGCAARGWTRRRGDAKPDHRARRQCRVPARAPRSARRSRQFDTIARLDTGRKLGIERSCRQNAAEFGVNRQFLILALAGARRLRRRRRRAGARPAAAAGQGRGGDARCASPTGSRRSARRAPTSR